jgi:hypothetical protein
LDEVVFERLERHSVYVGISAACMYTNAMMSRASRRQERISIGHIRHDGGQSHVTGRCIQIDLDDLFPFEIDALGASVSYFNGYCYVSGVNSRTYYHAIVNAVHEPVS